jgi:malate dehydrogenase
MNVSIVGAGGDIGREVAIRLIQDRVIDRDALLQLVGRPDGDSGKLLYGFVSDLLDANSENSPRLEVVLEPEAVSGDIIIFCAGQTVSTDPGKPGDRDALAAYNVPVFETYAQAVAKSAKGEEIVIVVSNPVELAVHIFSKYIDPTKIIGMGAFLDTIRFRREVAADLGVRRQMVRGLVIGQHGPGMVPLWSSVGAFGMDNEEGWGKLRQSRDKNRVTPREAIGTVRDLLVAGKVKAATAKVQEMPADLRVLAGPYVTHMTGAKTRVGTAGIVLRLIETITTGNQVLTACQTRVCGEFLGVNSVIGVPVLLNNQGIIQIHPLDIWDEEEEAFKRSAELINELISQY